MADVFLSYASTDAESAQRIATALEAAGYTVWWDRHLLSGEMFQQSIQRELAAAAAVVVVWTKASAASEWVYSEARRGHQRKALVQVRARDVDIDDIPAPFDALHCPLVDETDALLRAVAALATHPSPVASPTPGQERKVVTVLVADIEADTVMDIEEAESLLSPYLAGCRREVEGFGGTVEPAPGHALMATFGAPRAHEDDPERAVRTALGMLAVVTGLNEETRDDVKARIGIATGEALVSAETARVDGSPVTGHVLKAAHQLLSDAPENSALVDHATYAASRSSIQYAEADGAVAGTADPSRAWVPIASRGSVGEDLADRSLPMIGREDELAQLQRSLIRALRESSVQLVTIVAEPGLGKSRLVQALFDWTDAHEELLVTWRQGTCLPYGEALAFAALADIVKAQTGILDSDSDDVVAAKLEEGVHALVADTDLADQEFWLVARLSPLVGLPALETPREELFTAWRRFLEALAAIRPLVIVVEDLHWADQAMLDFLTHVLAWTVGLPLMIVATSRPELFDKAPSWGAGHRNTATLTLVALDDEETARLVSSLLGSRALPRELLTPLLDKAGGNPLYAREYMRILLDEPDEALDTKRARELAATLPGSIHAVIAARLDTLPSESKQLLQAAAVVGHTFWSGAMTALTGLDEAAAQTRLHDLARRDYVRLSRTSRMAGQAQYMFAHALIADVAYGQLPRGERARHHHAVAKWYTELATDPDGADPALVAHHYVKACELAHVGPVGGSSLAELRRVAASWSARAAEQLRSTDIPAAQAFAATAVRLSKNGDPVMARRLILLGDVQGLSGARDQEALQSLEDAAALAAESGDEITEAYARVLQSKLLRALGRPGSDRILQDAISTLERHLPGQEIVDAYVIQSQAAVTAGRSREAIACTDRALAISAHLPTVPVRLIVDALDVRGTARFWSGDPDGVDDLARGLVLANENHLTNSAIYLHDQMGVWYKFTRSARGAARDHEIAVRTASASGLHKHHLDVSANLAETLAVVGKLEEAIDVCEQAALEDREVGHSIGWAFLRSTWAWILTVRGDLLDAEQVLMGDALEEARNLSLPARADCLLVAAEWDAASGTDPVSSRFTAEFVELFGDDELDEQLAQYLARPARLLAAVGRLDLLAKVVDAVPGGMLLYELSRAAAQAVLTQARGDFAAAADFHAQAASGWADYGYPLEQAHSLLGAAACRAELGLPARQPLLEAEAVLDRIGAVPLLAHTRRLLAEIPG